jgi:hypothetical protein
VHVEWSDSATGSRLVSELGDACCPKASSPKGFRFGGKSRRSDLPPVSYLAALGRIERENNISRSGTTGMRARDAHRQ